MELVNWARFGRRWNLSTSEIPRLFVTVVGVQTPFFLRGLELKLLGVKELIRALNSSTLAPVAAAFPRPGRLSLNTNLSEPASCKQTTVKRIIRLSSFSIVVFLLVVVVIPNENTDLGFLGEKKPARSFAHLMRTSTTVDLHSDAINLSIFSSSFLAFSTSPLLKVKHHKYLLPNLLQLRRVSLSP